MSDKIMHFTISTSVEPDEHALLEYGKICMKREIAYCIDDTFISYEEYFNISIRDNIIITIDGVMINKKTFIEINKFLSRDLSKENYDKFRERFL